MPIREPLCDGACDPSVVQALGRTVTIWDETKSQDETLSQSTEYQECSWMVDQFPRMPKVPSFKLNMTRNDI